MGNEISLGAVTFASKKEAKARIREILSGAVINEPLSGFELSIVHGLLKRHQNYQEKVGCGLSAIVVRNNKFGNRERGFWVIRTDGTQCDFSYIKCFYYPSDFAKLKQALRIAVEPQISEYRKKSKVCEETGEKLSRGEFDIDHTPPWTFEYLSNTWMELMKIRPEDVVTEKAQYGVRLSDHKLEASWIRFHEQNARLRAVSRDVHRLRTKLSNAER